MIVIALNKLISNRFTRPLFNPAIRVLTRRKSTRALVNAMHNRLSFRGCESFFWSFASAYRGVDATAFEKGTWWASFYDSEVQVPLSRDRLWERWGIALGLRGHDAGVKETYHNILISNLRPDVFVDVGANYGTHSLLFAKANVSAVAFEPNPECAGFARELHTINDVRVEWHQVALGRERRQIVLSYPSSDYSLGRVGEAETAVASPGVRTVSVEQYRLDDYAFQPGGMLIKIDVEGRELEVLRGGETTLSARRPLVVFESDKEFGGRAALWELLNRAGYAISGIPWRPERPQPHLDRSAFSEAEGPNFIAVPYVAQ